MAASRASVLGSTARAARTESINVCVCSVYFADGSSPIPRNAFAGVAGLRIAAESPRSVVTAARRDVGWVEATTTAARRDLWGWVELIRPATEVVVFVSVSIYNEDMTPCT
jgi:hypothetical protein